MAGFRVLLKVEVVAGREADFERVWLSGRDIIAGHPANRGHWLCRSDTEATTYYVTSDWTDEAQFREFERSEAHLAHRSQLHPYRVGGSMATMSVLAGEAKSAEVPA
jgi:heme oxygenase (mycobilin-producing)